MAVIALHQSPRDRLAAMRGVTILDRACLPGAPSEVATVFAGIRSYRVTTTDEHVFSAAYHVRLGRWMALAIDGTGAEAFAAVADHVQAVAHLMGAWSQAQEDAEIAAAEVVLAGFAPAAPALPLAA